METTAKPDGVQTPRDQVEAVAADDDGGHEVQRLRDCDGECGPPREYPDSPEHPAEQDGAEDVTDAEDASGDQIVRAGLTALLSSLPDIEVAGTATTRREAIREVVTSRPDVALLDLNMPDLDGIAATREISRVAPEVGSWCLPCTTMTTRCSPRCAPAAARAYLVKGIEQEDIARAIRSVAAGEAIFGPGVAQRVRGFLTAPVPKAAAPFPS